MHDADDYTINKLGVLNDVLIERAGQAVAEEILKRFKGGRVLICIGKGNNGKDGVVVYKILSKIHGYNVTLFDVFNDSLDVFNNKYDIIIDCIFGTGLNKNVEGKIFEIIQKINSLKCFVVSCDIPSGLNGDNGLPMGVAVNANLTIAIQDYKTGHFLNSGKDFCGEVVVKDIGISVWEDKVINKFTKNELSKFFPQRKNNVHKGLFGKACVFGGSKNFPGSAIISANGLVALKMGTVYSNLSIQYQDLSYFDKSIETCKMAILLNPSNYFAYNNLAYSYFFVEDYENAIKNAKQSLSINEKCVQAMKLLVIIYSYFKDTENASKYEKLALENGITKKEIDKTLDYYLTELTGANN